MGIEAQITDSQTGKKAQVDTPAKEKQGLIVSTRPLKTYTNETRFFTNPTYGFDLNIAVSFGANPEVIYQENTEWTTSAIVGTKFIFNSTLQTHGGSVSIKTTNALVNDIMQLNNVSNFNLSGFTAITMWIYVVSAWAAGDIINIYGWDGTSIVGSAVDLSDYFEWGIYNTWHKITIPFKDMKLTNEEITDLRIQIADKELNSPTFYIDDIQIEQSGSISPVIFTVEPDLGTWLHVKEFNYFFADNDFSSIIADASVPLIPYNSFLGVAALNSGLTYQRVTNSKVITSFSFKQLSDILQLPSTELVDYGSTGATNTWIKIRSILIEPVILRPEDNDSIRYTVSEDLSGLDICRITVGCGIEQREL